jgi:hypothetical protein
MSKPNKDRESIKPGQHDPSTPTRGSSMQGPFQAARGAPAGANQGGAPRGSSRLEPSHQKRAAKKDQPKKGK